MQKYERIQQQTKTKIRSGRTRRKVALSAEWWADITHVLIDMDGTLIRQPGPFFFNMFALGVFLRMREFGTISDLLRAANKAKQILLSPHSFPSNEDAFFETLAVELKASKDKVKKFMLKFFNADYPFICLLLQTEPHARELVDVLRITGRHITLATNPVFGKREIELRLKTSHLYLHDFDYVTSWEDMNVTKPNQEFFAATLKTIQAKPKNTVMIGNDPYYDLPAHKMGIQTLLVGKNLSLKDIVESVPRKTDEFYCKSN